MELARLRKEKESINETTKNLDGRGVTNDEHLGNIWGYASKYEDRHTGKLPVTKDVEEQKELL